MSFNFHEDTSVPEEQLMVTLEGKLISGGVYYIENIAFIGDGVWSNNGIVSI